MCPIECKEQSTWYKQQRPSLNPSELRNSNVAAWLAVVNAETAGTNEAGRWRHRVARAGFVKRFRTLFVRRIVIMQDFVQTSAFVVPAVVPFVLIAKWRHWGLLASVLLGWGLVYLAAVSFEFHDKVDAVFAGIWSVLGWLYMLVWSLPIYIAVLIVSAIKTRRLRDNTCA